MLARIFVNRHIVAANKKKTKETGELIDKPAISVRTYKKTIYCKQIKLPAGAVLKQDASAPICSGATIWIECEFEKIKIII